MRSRLPFEIQRLNGRQALLGALKRGLVREREAQEERKEKSPSSRASRTPLSAPQNAAYEGHRRRITVILIHHLWSRISSTLSQHPLTIPGCLNEEVALTFFFQFWRLMVLNIKCYMRYWSSVRSRWPNISHIIWPKRVFFTRVMIVAHNPERATSLRSTLVSWRFHGPVYL